MVCDYLNGLFLVNLASRILLLELQLHVQSKLYELVGGHGNIQDKFKKTSRQLRAGSKD